MKRVVGAALSGVAPFFLREANVPSSNSPPNYPRVSLRLVLSKGSRREVMKKICCYAFVLAVLYGSCTVSIHAQNLPFKPQPTVKITLTCGSDVACQEKEHVSRYTVWTESIPVPHRTADKAFFLWEAISQVATVADVENSIYVLRHTPGTVEANPVFGKNPSRLRYYALMEGLYLAEIPFTWHYKREDDALKAAGFQGHKYAKWWILPAINTTAHGVGIGITLSSTGR